MALSYANRRRGQSSSKSWPVQKQASINVPSSTVRHQQQQQQHQQFAVRKQYSFIETPTGSQKYTTAQRGYLTRGISVDRSIESIRQKLYASGEQPKLAAGVRLSRQGSVDTTKLSAKHVTVKQLASIQHSKTNGVLSKNTALSNAISAKLKDRNLVAWSSTSSLLKTLDNEIDDANKSAAERHANTSSDDVDADNLNKNKRNNAETAKSDSSRINLNIVLSQTIRATNEYEHEIAHSSDIESTTDCGIDIVQSKSVTQRRAQFQQSRSTAAGSAALFANPADNININNNNNNNSKTNTQLSISPALTVQRRPPLVRAMSAPVRSLDDNSKSVIAANKRQNKLRRRKILTRNASCDKSGANDSDVLSADGNKKLLARSRTVTSPDVIITLVSLLSSEGSDSEREDNPSTTANTNGKNEQSPTRRAPLLRKTGKSVSFQDGYPPTFQLASKEYSHMLRRGSIAPLAARLRSNRPPTAPPVSIFLSDAHASQQTPDGGTTKTNASASMADGSNQSKPSTAHSEKENDAANCNVQAKEYEYPDYVRSIKERECWKLYQKMAAKGVSVSYDTILRGMLTPTEFRQLQKQREIQEAKAQEALDAAEAIEKPKPPTTAIERLSESLLNNQK